MSRANHTPGPWTLETVRTSSGICHKVGPFPWKQGKENHACIYADYASEGGPLERELLANARLIAAAPDMLDALHEAQAALSDGAFEGPHVDAALRAIGAALAKAAPHA